MPAEDQGRYKEPPAFAWQDVPLFRVPVQFHKWTLAIVAFVFCLSENLILQRRKQAKIAGDGEGSQVGVHPDFRRGGRDSNICKAT